MKRKMVNFTKAEEAILFARVSTAEQIKDDRFSIPAQVNKVREYCEKQNLKIIKEYKIDESSTKNNRKNFYEMISIVNKRRQKTAIIVEALDRLQRTFKELPLLEDLRKADKIELHFIRENLILDSRSNSSELIRWYIGIFGANSYVLNISDNVKRSLKEKFNEGYILGKAPVGYLNIKTTDGKKDVIVDPEVSQLVVKAFHEYATGKHTINTISEMLKKADVRIKDKNKSFSRANIAFMLSNKFYMGIQQSKAYGEAPHRYPPLISEAIFNKCQDVMNGRVNNTKPQLYGRKPFLFRGLIRCGYCGSIMTPDFKPKKNKTYLFCNSAKKGKCQNTGFVDYDKYVLSPFDNELDKITIPGNIVKIAVDHLQKEDKQEQNKNISAAKKVEKEIDDIQNRIDRLIDCIADEKDDSLREDYKNRISRLKTQQQGLKTNLTEIKNVSTEESKLTLSKILTLLKYSKDIFNGSNLEEKSEFLKIISSNFSLKGKTVSFFYKNLIQFLSKSAPCLNILRQ
ncbi:MAG: recombinase family protein [Elusimicrobia bacterium]|nr:recombinase family protein [Elusimicrobiota bacterium]